MVDGQQPGPRKVTGLIRPTTRVITEAQPFAERRAGPPIRREPKPEEVRVRVAKRLPVEERVPRERLERIEPIIVPPTPIGEIKVPTGLQPIVDLPGLPEVTTPLPAPVPRPPERFGREIRETIEFVTPEREREIREEQARETFRELGVPQVEAIETGIRGAFGVTDGPRPIAEEIRKEARGDILRGLEIQREAFKREALIGAATAIPALPAAAFSIITRPFETGRAAVTEFVERPFISTAQLAGATIAFGGVEAGLAKAGLRLPSVRKPEFEITELVSLERRARVTRIQKLVGGTKEEAVASRKILIPGEFKPTEFLVKELEVPSKLLLKIKGTELIKDGKVMAQRLVTRTEELIPKVVTRRVRGEPEIPVAVELRDIGKVFAEARGVRGEELIEAHTVSEIFKPFEKPKKLDVIKIKPKDIKKKDVIGEVFKKPEEVIKPKEIKLDKGSKILAKEKVIIKPTETTKLQIKAKQISKVKVESVLASATKLSTITKQKPKLRLEPKMREISRVRIDTGIKLGITPRLRVSTRQAQLLQQRLQLRQKALQEQARLVARPKMPKARLRAIRRPTKPKIKLIDKKRKEVSKLLKERRVTVPILKARFEPKRAGLASAVLQRAKKEKGLEAAGFFRIIKKGKVKL